MNIFLKSLWEKTPLSWAIIRATECELLSKQKYMHPILEIGCGDGFVSQLIFRDKQEAIDIGIDVDLQELRRAKKIGIYKKLLQVDITHTPFKDKTFETVFANGVLEHIPNLSKALQEIERILKPGGQLITTSPTANYSKLLFYYRLFRFLKLTPIARIYENFINNVFAHHHLYSHQKWQKLFQKVELKLEKFQYYNSKSTIIVHDLSLPFAMLSKLIKRYTDQMILFPKLHKIGVSFLAKLVSSCLNSNSNKYEDNASIFLTARKA